MGDFNPQEVANTAWAFVTVGRSDAQLSRGWQGMNSDAWAASTHRASPTQHGHLQKQATRMRSCFLTQRATYLSDLMKLEDLVPNVIIYSALISACEKGTHPE